MSEVTEQKEPEFVEISAEAGKARWAFDPTERSVIDYAKAPDHEIYYCDGDADMESLCLDLNALEAERDSYKAKYEEAQIDIEDLVGAKNLLEDENARLRAALEAIVEDADAHDHDRKAVNCNCSFSEMASARARTALEAAPE